MAGSSELGGHRITRLLRVYLTGTGTGASRSGGGTGAGTGTGTGTGPGTGRRGRRFKVVSRFRSPLLQVGRSVIMSVLSTVLLGAAAAWSTQVAEEMTDDPSTVTTADGNLRGLVKGKYRTFKGIPFAKPPLGKLRFAPPVAVEPWAGMRDAIDFRHNCIQEPNWSPKQPRETLDEDCLYLNVYTPSWATPTSMLPIMFWVHGGGWTNGGSNETRLNGTFNAADLSMIVVTTNYRLNIFGFLGGEAVRSLDTERGTTCNAGILDQREALRWVQRNIGAFGGNASNVLLAGESAGGASVYNHLVRPESWGLFAAAAEQSGSYSIFSVPQPAVPPPYNVPPLDFEKTYSRVLDLTNCTRNVSADAVACLQALDTDTLFNVTHHLDTPTQTQPCVDGVDLTAQIGELIKAGQTKPKVPFIAGGTMEDIAYPLYLAPKVNMKCHDGTQCTKDDLEAFVYELSQAFTPPWFDNATVAQFVDVYSQDSNRPFPTGTTPKSKFYFAPRHMGADFVTNCPARRSASSFADRGDNSSAVFLYRFSHIPEGPDGNYPRRSQHASDIPFIFRVTDVSAGGDDKYLYQIKEDELPLATQMVNAWISLAINGTAGPDWPAWKPSKNAPWMDFGNKRLGEVQPDDFMVAKCALWDKIGLPTPSHT